jgi:hypothetical protein
MVVKRGDRGSAERSQTENDSLADRNGRASEFLRQRHRWNSEVWFGRVEKPPASELAEKRENSRSHEKRLFRVRVRLVNWI